MPTILEIIDSKDGLKLQGSCYSDSNVYLYQIHLMDLYESERYLDDGRFKNYQRFSCPTTVNWTIDNVNHETLTRFLKDSVEFIADRDMIWNLELHPLHIKKIVVSFNFQYDEDAIIFKLVRSP